MGDFKHILTSATLLALFALVGTGLVAFIHGNTKERIAANERAAMLRNLNAVVPRGRYVNALLNDTVEIEDEALSGGLPVTVYRARRGGQPVAAVLSVVAPDGYGGPIQLLVGINYDETVAGVRIISHRETPGLGDAIDARRSDWVLSFDSRSLGDPPPKQWAVVRDGGVFDQFTGATITPRAVVKAVRNSLVYFSAHKDALFSEAPVAESSHE